MENGAVFADVDLLTGKQTLAPGFQISGLGQFKQEFKGALIDTLLGEVDEHAFEFEGEAGKSLRIICEKIAQMNLEHILSTLG